MNLLMRTTSIVLLVVTVHVIESEDKAIERWITRWKTLDAWKNQPLWRERAGTIVTDCGFDFRLGLVPPPEISLSSPALLLTTRKNKIITELRPDDTLPISQVYLCEYKPNKFGQELRPAHIMVSNSASYLFRQWPYLANRVRIAMASAARTMLLLGELPLGLATSVSNRCLSSAQGALINRTYCDYIYSLNDHKRRRLKSFYQNRTDGHEWVHSNHYNKILAARIALDHPYVNGIFYLDLDAFYTLSGNYNFLKVHQAERYDIQFAKAAHPPAFWLVKGGRFYARDAPLARSLLDTWLELRCGFKDQWSLWDTILNLAKQARCLDYNDELNNYTSYSAMKFSYKHHPALNIVHEELNCDFRFHTLVIPNRLAQSFSTNPIHRSVHPSDIVQFAYASQHPHSHSVDNSVLYLNVSNLLAEITPPLDLVGKFTSPQSDLLRVLGLLPRAVANTIR